MHAGAGRHPLSHGVEAIWLRELLATVESFDSNLCALVRLTSCLSGRGSGQSIAINNRMRGVGAQMRRECRVGIQMRCLRYSSTSRKGLLSFGSKSSSSKGQAARNFPNDGAPISRFHSLIPNSTARGSPCRVMIADSPLLTSRTIAESEGAASHSWIVCTMNLLVLDHFRGFYRAKHVSVNYFMLVVPADELMVKGLMVKVPEAPRSQGHLSADVRCSRWGPSFLIGDVCLAEPSWQDMQVQD